LNQVTQIIANKPTDFLVISGDDALTIPLISLGASGLISVVGNAFPKDWAEVVKQALSHNLEIANLLFYKYFNILEGVYREGNPTGVKCVMNQLDLCENILRLPLIKASKKLEENLGGFLNDFLS